MTRFVFVTGGVVSSLGKGLAMASLGALLQARGYSVRLRKLDPYLNVDPGTMSPLEHGEVFVTDDGAETDLDLGHYERFTGVDARASDSVSSGKIYSEVLQKEREGGYLGKTIQVIPHVTDSIKDFIALGEDEVDFMLCEIGGTVGDIEGLPFFEAIRQFAQARPRRSCAFIHLTLAPYIGASGEVKTKPTQHSVKELRSIGIQPDILICRTQKEISYREREKIALFSNLPASAIISSPDFSNIYRAPVAYHTAGLDTELLSVFGLDKAPQPDLARWYEIEEALQRPDGKVQIAIVGKYTELTDSYKSLEEALCHGAIANNISVELEWIDADKIADAPEQTLVGFHGILIPGGFGERGTGGKMAAIQFARERNIPFFGICFGMQLAVLETARNLSNIKDATSEEFAAEEREGDGAHIIHLMQKWIEAGRIIERSVGGAIGGTMRLGGYDICLARDSLAAKVYGEKNIIERHRHRYELDKKYLPQLRKAGMVASGHSLEGKLPEIIEIPGHPWFIGVQFHPELRSRPFEPHPLFVAYIGAALKHSRLV